MWEIIVFVATAVALIMVLRKLPVDAETTFKETGKKSETQEKSLRVQADELVEPGNDTFYNNLGLLYYETEDYDAAIEVYEKSVSINDKIASRLVNLGLAYFMNKKYRKAADQYEKAIILDPRNENYIELLKKAEEKLK